MISIVPAVVFSTLFLGHEVITGLLTLCVLSVFLSTHLGDFEPFHIDLVTYPILGLVLVVMMWYNLSCRQEVLVLGNLVSTCAVMMFSCDSIYWLFVWFESSLIPIVVVVVATGVQFERVSASYYVLMYTILLGSLFLPVYFACGLECSSLSLLKLSHAFSPVPMLYLLLVAFIVKIPVFLLHPWLPKAHLESGLSGSILLAGVLLKLGVYGLVRLLLYSVPPCSGFILSISAVGVVLSAWLSLSSSDIKITVAFSSVSHMNLTLIALSTVSSECVYGVLFTSFSHSVISVALFCYVTVLYNLTGSRSIVVSNGTSSLDSGLRFSSYLLWGINMCLPPTLGFLGELFIVSAVLSWSSISSVFVVLGVIGSSCACVINCLVLQHSVANVWVNGRTSAWSTFVSTLWSACLVALLFGCDLVM